MFVFKDVLMGLVAGIQLIANKMVAPTDWIEMPKYGADGDVIEITLTTVKVKNFDNTITTHVKSRFTLKKVGFLEEARLKGRFLFKGEPIDEVIYTI